MNNLKYLAVVLLLLGFSACTGIQQVQGNHQAVVQKLEAESEETKLSGNEYVQLCTSLFALRDYVSTMSCIEKAQAPLQSVENDTEKWTLTRDNATIERGKLELIRAQVSIDLLKYDEARTALSRAIEIVDPITQKTFHQFYISPSLAGAVKRDAYMTLAKIDYLTNDFERGGREFESMRSIRLRNLFGEVYPYKSASIDKDPVLHMAAKNYEAVLTDIPNVATPAKARTTSTILGVVTSPLFITQLAPLPAYLLYAGADPYLLEGGLTGPTFMRAKALLEVGQTGQSKELYDRLLSFTYISQNVSIYWLALFDRGRIAEAEGDLDGAADFYRQAIGVIEQQRARIPTDASKIGFIGDKQEPYTRLIKLLVTQAKNEEAFEYSERARSRALLDMLAGRDDLEPNLAKNEAIAGELRLLSQAEAKLSTVVVAETDVEGARKTRAVVDELRSSLHQEEPELASLVSVSGSKSADIQKLIGPNETLVSYFVQGSTPIAFVLTKSTIKAVSLPIGDRPLDAVVGNFRKALEKIDSQEWRALSRELYGRLIAPLEGEFKGDELIIVPHGVLHYVPFVALGGPGSELLVDRYALRYLPSASVMQFLKGRRTGPERLIAFGNPDLGDPSLDLKSAEQEARRVAALRPGSTVLVRKDATAAAFKQLTSDYRYIHYAGHARFDSKAPLSSGLYMARGFGDDGIVTATDLYGLHLDADLVALSACETGVGQAANGDEIIGLTRGFLYAGARSLLTTLWDIDDEATAVLMERFYRDIDRLGFAQALRAAQRAVRERYPHPLFWAAFQITGGGNK